MSTETENKLAESRIGRIVFHLFALTKTRKFRWHGKGIWREVIGV